jgi:hypothetical protein
MPCFQIKYDLGAPVQAIAADALDSSISDPARGSRAIETTGSKVDHEALRILTRAHFIHA